MPRLILSCWVKITDYFVLSQPGGEQKLPDLGEGSDTTKVHLNALFEMDFFAVQLFNFWVWPAFSLEPGGPGQPSLFQP